MKAIADFIKLLRLAWKAYRLADWGSGCYYAVKTFGGRTCSIMIAFNEDAITLTEKLEDMNATVPVDVNTLMPRQG